MMMPAAWVKWLRYRLLLPLGGVLSHSVAARVIAALVRWDKYHQPGLQLGLQANMQRVLPLMNAAEAEQHAQQYLYRLVREQVDVYEMWRYAPPQPQIAIPVQGLDQLQRARDAGQGVILVMAHYNRPIMLAIGLAQAGFEIGMVTMRIDASNPELDALDRHYLQKKVNDLQAIIGGPWVMQSDDFRTVYRYLSQAGIVIILLDAFQPNVRAKACYPFLGGQLHLARGIERIAQRTQSRLLYGVVHGQHSHDLSGELRPLPPEPTEALHQAVAELERDVLQAPGQWWQWNVLDALWEPKP